MIRDRSAVEIITHPATVTASIGVAVAQALGVPWVVAVSSVVWAKLSTIFTALSIAGFTLAPEVPWLPQDPLVAASLVIGGLYVAKLGDRVLERIEERL